MNQIRSCKALTGSIDNLQEEEGIISEEFLPSSGIISYNEVVSNTSSNAVERFSIMAGWNIKIDFQVLKHSANHLGWL